MKLAKDDLVAALRLRYDHYSAQSIFEITIARASLPDLAAYDEAQLATFRATLDRVGDRLEKVHARLDSLLAAPSTSAAVASGTAAAPATAAAPVIAAAPATADAPAAVPAAARSNVDAPATVDAPTAAPATVAAPANIAAPAMVAAAPGVHEAVDAPKPIETTITLAGVDAKDGDQLLVCGGLAALGNWDPDKAATMQRDGLHWRTTITVPPGTDAQFKFLRRSADGTVIWEDGDNRALVARPRIDATWR